LDGLGQRPPGDSLHDEEGLARRPASGLVERDDRRMLQARGQLGLAHEAPGGVGAAAEQHLDRDWPLVLRVPGFWGAAPAAAGQLAPDAEALGCDNLEPDDDVGRVRARRLGEAEHVAAAAGAAAGRRAISAAGHATMIPCYRRRG